MWSLLDLAPLAAVLAVLVLSAATLASALIRSLLPDPRPNLRVVPDIKESSATPTSGRRLRIV